MTKDRMMGGVRRPLIVDTDPGIDDAIALLYLLGLPSIDVVAVTTVHGNAAIDVVTRNALAVLQLAGRPDVPVAVGAAAPLVRPSAARAQSHHGDDGLAGVDRPAPVRRPVAGTAVEVMAAVLRRSELPVALLAIGPLTNVATLIQRHPELLPAIDRVVMMGGELGAGAAEFNVATDPEAADLVVGSGLPLLVVPFTLTARMAWDAATVDHVGPGQVRDFLSALIARRTPVTGAAPATIAIHDATAAAAVVRPDIFSVSSGQLWVDCSSGAGSGQTTFHPDPDGPLSVAVDCDHHALVAELRDALARCATAGSD